MRRVLFVLTVLGLAIAYAGCGSGQYGYAHEYETYGDEGRYLEQAADLSYEEVRRTRPEEQRMVGWFGVLLAPPEVQGSTVRVQLSLRAHQDRHLCSTSASDSCRVTVSAREIGRFTAILPLRPEDREGRTRLWTGSLVRVYGTATGETDADDGPVLQAQWYRHWPAHYYVTTAAAGSMRR